MFRVTEWIYSNRYVEKLQYLFEKNLSQRGFFCRNIRKKIAAEKKNSESSLPTRIIRYTETHQRINKKKKDNSSHAISALCGGKKSKSVL